MTMLGLLLALLLPPSGIGVLTNFEGGSVGKVEQVSATHLRCAVQGQSDQDHRNRQADWYYFELANLPGQPITLDLVDLAGEYNYKGPAYSVTRGTRPVYSYDGADWRHFSDDQVSWDDREPHLTLHFTPERDHLWIAHVEPYTHKHLAALLDSFRKSPYFKEQSVGRTVEGRGMPLLTITNPQIPEAKKKAIWLMFRQHAWETGSSWVGDGAVRYLFSKDEHAACIRDQVIYKIFPLADPDGVADGGVRFNRNGYDLSRNWDMVDPQKMPEIAAQRRAIFDWVDSGHRLDLFLSLRNTEEIEYLEAPAPFSALGERVYRALAETTSFHPTAALREMATTTTPGGSGRMTVDEGLFHDRQLPAMLMEQMIEYNSKLGRVPTLEDRREFGAEHVRALAAAVTERDSTDAAPPQDVRKALEGTTPFERPENIIEQQYLQIYEYFSREIAATPAQRDELWHPDYSSLAAYRRSLVDHRDNLRKMLGLVEMYAGKAEITSVETDEALRVEEISIPLDKDFRARALLFLPRRQRPGPAVIAIPPAMETREQFAGLAEGMTPARWLTSLLRQGVAVSIPIMVERSTDCPLCMSLRGTPPNYAPKDRRLILHRLGFIVGRTLVGLEVEQVIALRAFLSSRHDVDASHIAVLGEGQGGMTALYAAAVDERLASATVVDYFEQRERSWMEPVDRMLYGQLNEFGDAEVAALIAPRPLIIQRTPSSPVSAASALEEFVRAQRFYRGSGRLDNLISAPESDADDLRTGALMTAAILGVKVEEPGELRITLRVPFDRIDKARNEQFEALHRYLRRLDEESDKVRENRWKLLSTAPADRASRVKSLQEDLSDLMGVIPLPAIPLNPRTSLIKVTDKYAAYDVLLNALPGVEAYGQLLVPRNVRGRAPAVICEHGIGGKPWSVTGIGGDPKPQVYHEFAARLAERGYVTFAPYLTVPEGDDRRISPDLLETLVRQAATLGRMRTSVELVKVHCIVDFLQSQPFVDPEKIGYYGLSYGGYSAIWMGPLEPRLKAVIISGYFNDWRAKITDETNRKSHSFLFSPNDDMHNWNVLNRFTHLELIAAMWPRAVCVEFGEQDITTTPEWHARAWAQVADFARAWDASDRIVRDRFDGPHEIHGVLTFQFLDRWLQPGGRTTQ